MTDPAANHDPELASRLAWIAKVRGLHRNKRMIGFAGVMAGAGMLLWWKMTPQAPDWAQCDWISYEKYGYLPFDTEGESVSRTLEYGIGDDAVARVARAVVVRSPHAHARGYATRMTVRYPDGHEVILHNQPRYDFNWQREYVFSDWLPIPKGSIMIADYIFDNSVNNRSNPDPKIDVAFGEQTFEEMLFTYLQYRIVGEDREHPRDDVQAAISKSIGFSVLDDNIDRKIQPEELRGKRFEKVKANNAGTANTKIAADMLLSKDLKDVKAGTCDLVP